MRFVLLIGLVAVTAGCAGRVSARFETHIRPHAEKISMCYLQALQRDPAAAGEIEVVVTVAGDGKVIAADLVKNTFADDQVGRCVAGVLQAVSFPASHRNETVTFSYPVVFTQEVPESVRKP